MPEVQASQQAVIAVLDPLLDRLRGALSSASREIQPPAAALMIDPGQTRTAATQLTKLLSEFDSGAVEFIETNHRVLQALFTDHKWPAFEKLVQDYAFAEAQAQLEQAIKQLPVA
jgi:hypothetical protein